MKNTYIFDFDFTLADSSKGAIECIKYSLLKMGELIPDETEIKKTIGLSLKDTFNHLTKNTDIHKEEIFSKLFIEKADEVMADLTYLYKDTQNVIKKIHSAGNKIGIVSTKFRYRINIILQREKLDKYFDLIIGGEDVNKHKPDAEGLLKIIEYFCEKKSNVVYIGDSIIDAKTAKNAGVDFIASLTGVTKKEDFQDYTVMTFINDLSELS